MDDDGDRILTVAEVSRWTNIAEGTLRWFRYKGDRGPRSFKLGRKICYRESDVRAWIEQRYHADRDAARPA